MFEEAPNEKIERLRRNFELAEASVEHINKKKLKLLDNLITFTKYICHDLRNLPPALSRFLIGSGNKVTNVNLSLFTKAVFHHIERFQDAIIAEEGERTMFLEDEKQIVCGKDGELFKNAKRYEEGVLTFLGTDEECYLEVNLKPWYETLHEAVKLAIDAVYRKYAERQGYLQYLRPLEENLRHALKILKRIILIIEREKREFEVEIKKLEETEKFVHENKFAFAR
ncbi:hypothetical protein HYU07_00025 [Candidatus Woesearchaeota archaeon]|nr:hypothetical protein [Candidatus Woesearchaeota archaeon]